MFVWDGQDESRLELDLDTANLMHPIDVTKSVKVEALLENLIGGICFPLLASG